MKNYIVLKLFNISCYLNWNWGMSKFLNMYLDAYWEAHQGRYEDLIED